MKVRFLENTIFESVGRLTGTLFKAGSTHEFRDDFAQKWLKRRVAELVEDAAADGVTILTQISGTANEKLPKEADAESNKGTVPVAALPVKPAPAPVVPTTDKADANKGKDSK